MDTSRKTLKDSNRCNYCINYEPLKKNGKTYCRGKCRVTGSYKQRTSCCSILADTEILRPTGLKDRNGKEIYENDIVAYSDSCEPVGYSYERDEFCNYGKVVWVEEYARFDVTNRNDVDSEDVWDPDEIEVMGNIYENPELLDKI